LEAGTARSGEGRVPLRGVVSPRRICGDQLGVRQPGGGRFYNKRGTAEQWIKEGKQTVAMTRLSCHRFRANEVRLWLSVIAYNLGNLWRRLALPARIGKWSLTSLQKRLMKTGGRLIQHARYYWLLLAESHLTRRLFGNMLQKIAALPSPAG
jgi:Transposase DDE domain group 1